MIWQRYALGCSCQEVAKNLSIDKPTVSRISQLFDTSGSVSKKSYSSDRAHRKITLPTQLLIFQLVMEKPGIRLREIQEELFGLMLASQQFFNFRIRVALHIRDCR